jgi:hypothetical protein
MQPGSPGPGQDPYQQNPYQPYPTDPVTPYSTPPAGEQYPTSPSEYSLYPPQPQYPATPPAYPPSGYPVPPLAPPTQGNANIFGLLSMIFGIISLPLSLCCFLGVLLGVAGIVLGVIGVIRANAGQATNKGMSIAGIACGAGSFVLLILSFFISFGLSSLTHTTHY